MANEPMQGQPQADAELQNAIETIKRLTTTGEGAQLGTGSVMRDFMGWMTETFPGAFGEAPQQQQQPAPEPTPDQMSMPQYQDFRLGGGGRY